MQDGRYAFRGKKHLLLPLLFLLPQLAITVVFFFYPAGEALMGSFYMEDSFGLSKEFVGLDNFITLFSDPSYLETLRLTLVFSLATIVLTMGTALLFAVLADQVNWGGTLYKSMLIIPYAVAPPLAGVLWLFLFNPSGGVLTELLHHFGYTWNHKINGNQALFLLIVSASWKQISYNFLFFLAGLHAIPRSLIEAAAIDGAGPWRFFVDVVLPLSRTNTAALFVVLFIYGWNQYLWPLLVTNQESMYTIVMGIQRMVNIPDAVPEWNLIMAVALLGMLPPLLVVLGMQKLFVRGLVETEK